MGVSKISKKTINSFHSGVSFLIRVQKKLHEKLSFSQTSSIFTFGDAPLPEFDPSYFVLVRKYPARSFFMFARHSLSRPQKINGISKYEKLS